MKPIPWPRRFDEPPLERLARLLPDAAFIVDGGANKGRLAERFLTGWPGAAVLAFEPLPRLARRLAKRFAAEPRLRVRQAALGAAPGVLTLNVLQSATCSSLLAPTGIRDKHADKPMDVAERVEVEVVRLDAECAAPPDILKLDLQGYELEALKGARGLLPGIGAVLCEVSFTSLYAGQPLGWELAQWMEGAGYRMDGLHQPWFGPDGALVSADALFVRT